MSYDPTPLRADEFAWANGGQVAYLNHAGTGPLPRRTVETLQSWAAIRAEPWRTPDHSLVFPVLDRTRQLCAKLIGALPAEIALVPNTSHGLNVAARALPIAPGDVVLISDGEFPSTVYVWQSLCRSRGITTHMVPTRDGLLDEEAILRLLDAPQVKAVTVSWVSFATGYRIDLERLGAECRARGIYLIVDAVQGLGPAVLDVNRCAVDFLACGGHKWLLGPWGTGFLFVRRDLIGSLEPPLVGWLIGPQSHDYNRLLDYDLRYYEDARRFEMMTLPTQDFAGLSSSIELLLELDPGRIESHVNALADRIISWAVDQPRVRLVTPRSPSRRAGIVTIALPNAPAASERLAGVGVKHSLREGAIRLSPYCYNTADEIDCALSVLGAS